MSRLTRDGTGEETKFSGANGDGEKFVFPVQLTTSRIGNLTRLIHTLLYVMAIHTYHDERGRVQVLWSALTAESFIKSSTG